MSGTSNDQQPQQAAPNNAPVLCQNGCGFFGSEATAGCCSKCWMATLKRDQPNVAAVVASVAPTKPTTQPTEPEPMELCMETTTVTTAVAEPSQQQPSSVATATMKKKKKKTSYKNMMASMMVEKKSDSDKKKDDDMSQHGLGGGQFIKVDQI